MIIEFEPRSVLASVPAQWWLYYREENEPYFHKIAVTYPVLKAFLEQYGYATNNKKELSKFGINTANITENPRLY